MVPEALARPIPPWKQIMPRLKKSEHVEVAFTQNGWLDRLLAGTTQYYSCFLAAKLGRLTSLLLKMFYSGIKVQADQTAVLKQIPDTDPIVYINKNKSKFAFSIVIARRFLNLVCKYSLA